MKTKTLKNGNIKVWYDREEEFTIVNKNEPLYDTLIDGYELVRKHSQTFLKEIKDAGLNDIHDVFIDIDDSFEERIERLNLIEMERTLHEFNSIFNANIRYHVNDNGLKSLLFGKLESYQDFVNNYFSTFLFKMVAFKINILLSKEKNETVKGLYAFISKFADDYLKIYLKASTTLKFDNIIREKG